MFEIKYVQKACPDIVDLTDEIRDVGREMLAWVKERDRTHGDCAAISAPQLGMTYRLAVMPFDDCRAVTANMHITQMDTESGTFVYPVKLINFPEQRARFTAIKRVGVSFDDVITGEAIDDKWLEGTEALTAQMMCHLMDGKELDIVQRDFRTIRSGAKIKANSACPCGSDRKYKRCCQRG